MRWHGVFDICLNALDVGIDVAVRYQNVWPAIEIVIKEEASESESEQGSAANFRAWSLVNEESFSFVVIEREHLVREIRNQEAGKAGVIVVGGVHTHAGARDAVFAESDSRNDGFFRERAVAIVAIEFVRLRIIRKQQVGPAVIVEVEDGDPESF